MTPQTLQRQIEDMQRQYRQFTATQPQQSLPPLSAPPAPIIPHQVQYVEGLAGARLYQDGLMANSSEIIMDKDDDVFYRVSKDANGIVSKKIPMARFSLIEPPQEEMDAMYITKKDLSDFKQELISLLSAPKVKPTKEKTTE